MTRVLVGESVFEPATLNVRDGMLWVSFEAEDLDDLAFDVADLRAALSEAGNTNASTEPAE
jgi:hypothetical protein